MTPRYQIYVRTIQGEVFMAFVWCSDEASGIARAQNEAPKFGYDVADIWAVTIH